VEEEEQEQEEISYLQPLLANTKAINLVFFFL
jgi:hypothetical protein